MDMNNNYKNYIKQKIMSEMYNNGEIENLNEYVGGILKLLYPFGKYGAKYFSKAYKSMKPWQKGVVGTAGGSQLPIPNFDPEGYWEYNPYDWQYVEGEEEPVIVDPIDFEKPTDAWGGGTVT